MIREAGPGNVCYPASANRRWERSPPLSRRRVITGGDFTSLSERRLQSDLPVLPLVALASLGRATGANRAPAALQSMPEPCRRRSSHDAASVHQGKAALAGGPRTQVSTLRIRPTRGKGLSSSMTSTAQLRAPCTAGRPARGSGRWATGSSRSRSSARSAPRARRRAGACSSSPRPRAASCPSPPPSCRC